MADRAGPRSVAKAASTSVPTGDERLDASKRYRLELLGDFRLLVPSDDETATAAARGRKLVLLAYLALATRPVPRDRLATLLWGHRDDERAKHSLRDVLSGLRQALGDMIPRGRENVSLSATAPLDVDVLELRVAAHTGDHAKVVALYRGPFLDGVHIGESPEAEDWIAQLRLETELLFLKSCAAECLRLESLQAMDSCAELARRWLLTDPTSAEALTTRLRALAADRGSAALRAATAEYQRHATFLAREFDEEPAVMAQEMVREFAERITMNGEGVDVVDVAVVASPTPVERVERVAENRDATVSTWPTRWTLLFGLAAIAATLLLFVARVRPVVTTALPTATRPEQRDDGFHLDAIATNSAPAYQAYVAALDRLNVGRVSDAARLLDIAVAADSSFVAAVHERINMLNSQTVGARDSIRRLTNSLNHSLASTGAQPTAFDRQASELSELMRDGNAMAASQVARDLVAQYGRDPRSYSLLTTTLFNDGSFREASRLAVHVLARDSSSATSAPYCVSCSQYGTIVTTALQAGDAPTALAAARRAVALRRDEPSPWIWLSRAAVASGNDDAAVDAAMRALKLAPHEETAALAAGWLLLEVGRLDEADSLIHEWSHPGSPLQPLADDLLGGLLRERGQYRDAVVAYTTAVMRAPTHDDSATIRLPLASSLMNIGERTESIRSFELAARHPGTGAEGRTSTVSPSLQARGFAWPHALLADALYLAGSRDTIVFRALADSVETIGRRSAYGRDWHLHHHIRGLIAMSAQRWAEAAREFQLARWGASGWTRTNVELARAQMAQGLATDAVHTLRDVRFGTLDGMGRYAPRNEIRLVMVEALLAAGQPDSARVYLDGVAHAWAHADASAMHRLAATERLWKDANALRSHRVVGARTMPQ